MGAMTAWLARIAASRHFPPRVRPLRQPTSPGRNRPPIQRRERRARPRPQLERDPRSGRNGYPQPRSAPHYRRTPIRPFPFEGTCTLPLVVLT
jgi:hypothetical protein